jgi:hypothetical protein
VRRFWRVTGDSGETVLLLPAEGGRMSKAKRSTYEVIAGNVGTVYSGKSESDAAMSYIAYVDASERGEGRVGNEHVTMLVDGEIRNEHDPVASLLKRITESLQFEFDRAVDAIIHERYVDVPNDERHALLRECEKIFDKAAERIADKLVGPLKRRLEVGI